MNRNRFVLLAILLLAFFLRFYRLGDFPALNADEAAVGYNAYSLIQTGADEHGNPWPIHFQSFNDYKPGLYFYLVLPFVKILGLNEWAVRLPSAFLGVVTVLVIYLLTKELFVDREVTPAPERSSLRGAAWNNVEVFALISAFFLAISPWHVHFSRGGWEVNVATFFLAAGVWLFLRFLRKVFSIKYLVLSVLLFVLSLYTYHSARVVVPLLLLGIFAIFRKELYRNLKKVLVAGLIGIILLIPLGLDLTKGSVLSRAGGVGLFADPGPIARINEQRGEHEDLRSLQAVLFHNKAINYGLTFLDNWGEHFWGEFLFLSGDKIQRNRVPETGQMYLFDIIFVFAGIIFVIKNSRNLVPIILWLVVAPTAAAFTFQSPHALRAQNMVIPLVVISAYGLSKLIEAIRDTRYEIRFAFYILLITFVVWNFTRYLNMYYLHMTKEYPFSSQYGLKELASYIKENGEKYEKIIVTDRYDQPYSLFLFYLKYPPEAFQNHHELTPRDKFGFSTVRTFDKYMFEPINFDKIRPENPNSLIVGTDEEIPDEANIIERIYGSNDYLYFEVVEN